MSSTSPRSVRSPRFRLSIVLLLLIAWDALAILAELTFGGLLFNISDDRIGGWMGAKGALGGAAVVPLTLYVYALVRGPLRYQGLVWVGVLEQAATALFAVYHLALGHMRVESGVVPIVVSLALVVLILLNMPYGRAGVAEEPSTVPEDRPG
jgi:hypothetical protein